jgi:hypothetical protein
MGLYMGGVYDEADCGEQLGRSLSWRVILSWQALALAGPVLRVLCVKFECCLP